MNDNLIKFILFDYEFRNLQEAIMFLDFSKFQLAKLFSFKN